MIHPKILSQTRTVRPEPQNGGGRSIGRFSVIVTFDPATGLADMQPVDRSVPISAASLMRAFQNLRDYLVGKIAVESSQRAGSEAPAQSPPEPEQPNPEHRESAASVGNGHGD